jgi:succinate dehydrogenase / fumarate reductase flavoprotein subunit
MTDILDRIVPGRSSGSGTPPDKVPGGPLADKWDTYIADAKLVNPNNKRKFKVIVVGTGLAGASAAATLAELGYQVEAFTFHDSPRRAHSIAAQGGINASKNYRGDGDSVHRLFYDTIKGGDFRAREGNVYRLAQVSGNIIDQMVAQGVPFAREYGGMLDNRSFGGAQVSRTFYARGQTGQQLLLGAYQQMSRQVGLGNIKLWNRIELVDVVTVDGVCAGIVTRDLLTNEVRSHAAHAVILATGGYGNVFFLSTNAMACNVTAAWRAHRKGALFANPCYTQIHPTCIPQSDEFQSKLTLMSESLRNDGRVWVPSQVGDERSPDQIPDADRDYYLERLYPSFGNLAPRDISSRAAKRAVDSGRGVGPLKNGVYLDFSDAINRLGSDVVRERYGNLFEMYERITGESPYDVPMRIYPASHYTMGGLWVDYELMTSVPGLYAAGEANFSDHGANRLGASALMQGLADGYFVLPYTLGNYLAPMLNKPIPGTDHPEFVAAETAARQRFAGYLSIGGSRSPDQFHRELGKIVWDYCGMDRNEAGLEKALSEIPALYDEFQRDLRVTGGAEHVNQTLEKAGRVDDFFQLAMLMCRDALERRESCGGHFRSEYQTEEGEALRDDENFAHVAAWEWTGDPMNATRRQEDLVYETVHFQTRSYK